MTYIPYRKHNKNALQPYTHKRIVTQTTQLMRLMIDLIGILKKLINIEILYDFINISNCICTLCNITKSKLGF